MTGPTDASLQLDDIPRVHIVGIGGAGMSAIATLLVSLGHEVSGSDFKDSRFVQRLRSLGVRVALSHDASHVGDVDAVAISSAVRESNPEVRAARERGIRVLRRHEILGLLTRRWRTIAVAGTHGKTTTSSMLATVLVSAGADPTYLVGGELNEPGANAARGGGEWFVCEADESDGSFLELGAVAGIVTNVEADHLEHYGSLEALEAAFHRFLTELEGPRVVGLDDAGARRVAAGLDVVGFGFGDDCRYRAVEPVTSQAGVSFRLVVDDADHGTVNLSLPGRHNVRNALAVAAMACEIGVTPAEVAEGLGRFRGVGRRFERRGEVAGVTLVDDYAHLPTEVDAVLEAARSGGWSRVVAVFQPHLYSRTAAFGEEFGRALAAADVAFVTDVFAAREDPVPGVTGEIVVDAAVRAGGVARYVPHRGDVAAAVAAELRDGDVCLSIGAGDITTLADELAVELHDVDATDPAGGVVEDLVGKLTSPPQRDYPLAPLTTYKIGGSAAVFVEPDSADELLDVRTAVLRHELPVLIVGRGSNTLVSDRGFPGVAIRLGAGFNAIDIDGTTVVAGSATPLPFLARSVGRAGLTGLEFGVGIPASVGGAVRMNAGGHGSDISTVLDAVGVVDLGADGPGRVEERAAADLDLRYRHSALGPNEVVVWARFALGSGDAAAAEAAMNEIVHWRKEHQPAGPSAGSVFTNPPGDSAGRLIDTAGCKDLRVGGAYVSPKHANFILAEPWARAADVYAVIRAVARRVASVHGVELVPEVRLVGVFDDEPAAPTDDVDTDGTVR